jgi:hypothetical protein
MLAPIVHILPLTTIQRERILPAPGKVVVRKGQRVAARDVIAVANLSPEHLLLNITRGLGVSIQEANDLIQCEVDENVSEGDLIAGPVGLTRRVVRAPVNGVVKLVGDGRVLLEVEKDPFELQAGMVGLISKLIPDYGAVVETTGALIQGVWGNGQADFGLVQLKLENPDDEVTAAQIDVSLRGTILLAGHCKDPMVLKKAAEVPIKGLILTSIPSTLVPVAKKMNYPVIVLEGFGRLPLNQISYNLLTTHPSREIVINAEAYDFTAGQRPEVIIPLPSGRELDPPLPVDKFSIGQQVLIVRKPYQTRTGKIELLYNGLMEFPSGIRAPGALISLEEGEKVRVPLVNLEVVA